MAPVSPAPKRIKVSSISKANKRITSLCKPGFDESDVTVPRLNATMGYKSPVTLEKVFGEPTQAQVAQFFYARNNSGTPFDHLPEGEKLRWRESLHDTTALMGYLVYSQLFPSQLQNRIKTNIASYHYRELDGNTKQGRGKLQQRRDAYARLQRVGSDRSVFYGLPYTVGKTKNILQYMKLDFEEDDSRYRFFMHREFSMIYSERGEVGSSSVYSSCSSALRLLYFAVVILGRPCCFESIVLPLTVVERRRLEQTWGCPGQHLDGPIRSFETSWREVFGAIGVGHRTMDYVMLERATGQKYVEGLHVTDAFAVYRASKAAPRDTKSITTLVQNYKKGSKKGFEAGAVVACCDVLRERPVGTIGRVDGSVLGSIYSTYGEKAAKEVQARCLGLQDGASSLFDASVGNKLNEIVAFFDAQLWKVRKKLKVELNVVSTLDPAGLNKKTETGKMLDPTDPKAVELMYGMLKGLSGQVWRPLKSLIGEALGPRMEYPSAFLRISDEEGERLYEHAKTKGMRYADVANLYVLLALSNCFQRSQVMREARMHEFALVPGGTHYRQRFKDRTFKTVTAAASDGARPVSHFNLSPDQSMMVHFLAFVAHRFCDVNMHDEKRRLFVNSKGEWWTQGDIRSRFNTIGENWLGIKNFAPHACRTFWATAALNSGQIDPSNIEDFGSFLQVSTATLRSSYVAAGANTAAHKIGSDVLGGVVNSACSGEMAEKGARPSTKKLGARRMEFVADVRASLLEYGGKTRLLFRDLVSKRKGGRLGKAETWFAWDRTFFEDDDERHFKRFIDNHV